MSISIIKYTKRGLKKKKEIAKHIPDNKDKEKLYV